MPIIPFLTAAKAANLAPTHLCLWLTLRDLRKPHTLSDLLAVEGVGFLTDKPDTLRRLLARLWEAGWVTLDTNKQYSATDIPPKNGIKIPKPPRYSTEKRDLNPETAEIFHPIMGLKSHNPEILPEDTLYSTNTTSTISVGDVCARTPAQILEVKLSQTVVEVWAMRSNATIPQLKNEWNNFCLYYQSKHWADLPEARACELAEATHGHALFADFARIWLPRIKPAPPTTAPLRKL